MAISPKMPKVGEFYSWIDGMYKVIKIFPSQQRFIVEFIVPTMGYTKGQHQLTNRITYGHLITPPNKYLITDQFNKWLNAR